MVRAINDMGTIHCNFYNDRTFPCMEEYHLNSVMFVCSRWVCDIVQVNWA